MSQISKENRLNQEPPTPGVFEGVIELSNNNFKALNEALELMHEIAKNNRYVSYYFNIDVNDIVFVELNNSEKRKARIYLRNGLIIVVDEYFNDITIKSSNECYCGE
jgi:hypothetical protein